MLSNLGINTSINQETETVPAEDLDKDKDDDDDDEKKVKNEQSATKVTSISD